MENVHYNVSGMANSQSKTQLHNALEKLQGVQQIAIDISRGTVEVGYNAPASENKIKDCIEHTGYTVQ
ncbi:heavy-metal-associated domain-containing protein [Clostridium sp.]|uniref:heavy-metal-associated domain-containing protein n=1 Tax=Clostridium sp. TaxID=1506 RepID=UPI002FC6534F